jgi:chromate transporter
VISLWQMLIDVLGAGLAAVGGGSGAIAVVQHAWVESGILDPALFAWALALGHVTPGPISTSIAGMGFFVKGLPGAIVAMVGVNIPTWLGSIFAMRTLRSRRQLMAPLLRPAVYVVAGLGAGVAIRTGVPLQLSIWEIALVSVVAYLVGWRRIDPLWILSVAAMVGVVQYLAR